MRIKNLKGKGNVVLTAILIVVITAQIVFLSVSFATFSNSLIQEKLLANINGLRLSLDDGRAFSKTAAVIMAEKPDVIKAVEQRETEELLRLFTPTLDLFRVNYYTITDNKGVVLARTHEPENYGDSVINQQNVIDALEGKVSTYFEQGTAVRVSVRTGAPVYSASGELIGVVSAGVRFDTPEAVRALGDLFHAEVTIFLGDERIASTIVRDGQSIVGTALDPKIADIVISNKQEYIGNADILGERYKTFYMPLLNSQDEAFAVVFIGMPMQSLQNETNRSILTGAVIVLCGIVFLLILLYRNRQEKKQLVDLAQQAEAASTAKTSFLSNMSHEIRTPMNAILGVTEILMEDESLTQDTKDSLSKIYASGDLLLGIINDILDLSKIEAGKLELIIERYSVASLISDTAQLNMMRIGSKLIEFELSVDEDMPANMTGDELRVKQILNNILSNAFKYTSKGTVALSVSAEPADSNNVTLVLTVSDTGQGMTNEQVEKLFDEYTRFNMETNRTTEGTGLGMSITRNLIQLMDGEIFIESEPGQGSTFTVYLPQGKTDDAVLGSEMAENLHNFRTSSRAQMRRVQITREPMPYGSVLIVDDVETNIYVAKGLMTPYKLRIDSVSSGFAAIDKIDNGNVYDVVFMDHMMPQMDGIETTQKLRDMGYNAPIVALTANAVAGQAEIFLGNGFDDFISKPIDLRQLNTVLNKLIRDKQKPEVIEAARKQAEKDAENGLSNGSEAQTSDLPKEAYDLHFAEIFARDASNALAALEALSEKNDYSKEDDLRSYIINVHGMKSALANIGKMDLSAVALKLETAGRENKLDIITSETTDFLTSLREFVEKLIPHDESAPDAEDEDKEYLREKLLIVKTSCEQFDAGAADEALSELRQTAWSHHTKGFISAISAHLLHSDFDDVVDAISEFLENS